MREGILRIKIILLSLMLLSLLFQNCVDSAPVKFFDANLSSLKSELSGGPYEGKPEHGYYCRVYDQILCQPQVQNLHGLVKVDNSGIHLIQDSCASTSVKFKTGDLAVDYTALNSNFLGVSRGIFKKCEMGTDSLPIPETEMGTDSLPIPETEMADAYCVSSNDNLSVVVNKNLSNQALSFDLFFRENSQVREVRGGSVTKLKNSLGENYTSSSQEFSLEIKSSNSQTNLGKLKVVVDEKPINIDLNCRIASPAPTVIIKEDLEISPTWIDTSNLVGYWKLNEPNAANGTLIVDSSRYGANGTLLTNDGGLVKSDNNVSGGSLFFDGTSDSVDIPLPADGHLNFGMNSFTFMVWIKKTGNAGSFDMPIWKGGSSSSYAGFDMECGTGSMGCLAYVSDGLGQPSSIRSARFTWNSSSLIGRWVLLTAVVDRDLKQLRAYLDGALITTVDISTVGSVTSDLNLQIGAFKNVEHKHFFMGNIDDVSIWNRTLTENEISEIFQRLRPKFY